jgi:hypothetical protein
MKWSRRDRECSMRLVRELHLFVYSSPISMLGGWFGWDWAYAAVLTLDWCSARRGADLTTINVTIAAAIPNPART